MKISCDVVRDLMLLCEDDGGSEDSKMLVKSHKKDCKACAEYYNQLYRTEELLAEVKSEFKDEQILHNGFRKIKRRWIFCLTGLLMVIPIVVLFVLGRNEYRGEGVCFSNADDIYRCIRFMNYIEKEEFDKAVGCIDFAEMQYDFAENVKDLSRTEFVAYMREKVENKLEEYHKLGISIRDISYDYAYKIDEGWMVELSFYEVYPGGSSQRITVILDADTMCGGAYTVVTGNKNIYIDEILRMLIQDDPLGYGEMEETFYLKEGERAIVSWDLDENRMETIDSIHLFQLSYGTGFGVDVRDEHQRTQQIEASVPGEYAVVVWDKKGERVDVEDVVKILIEKY